MSHILTLSDRTIIQTLLKVGYSQKQIAEEVGVAPSTINYELKRCPKGYYDADQAQEDCEKKLTHRGRKTLLTENSSVGSFSNSGGVLKSSRIFSKCHPKPSITGWTRAG
ncbi:helix-turn-helix domain-containing protein [Limosilactobacillus fermentum]|uniref:helix-turn-helix domain-containing protein n=1 Tax=Limosilactobacillus fermentum TaxID=1613 RepID=UPI0039BF38CA